MLRPFHERILTANNCGTYDFVGMTEARIQEHVLAAAAR
jgi:hypothetical protein